MRNTIGSSGWGVLGLTVALGAGAVTCGENQPLSQMAVHAASGAQDTAASWPAAGAGGTGGQATVHTGHAPGPSAPGGQGGLAMTNTGGHPKGSAPDPLLASMAESLGAGRETFRFDTFGSEAFWGDSLKLHQAIAGAANGGVGPGLSPRAALEVGLKVDAEALPPDLVAAIAAGQVDLDDPATTLALLQLDAVVGLTGFFGPDQRIRAVGIQCALCHSQVDDSFAPGIGKRLDGWANRDLNVGAIIALAPDLTAFTSLLGVDEATLKSVLLAWGPGKFDAELVLDGKALRPDGKPGATLIPPAFGLAGQSLHTWTGWGSVPHWNGLVANLEMMGTGTFYDPRLNDAARFPIAARNMFGDVRKEPDRITDKLADLHVFQLALPPPAPPGRVVRWRRRRTGRGRLLWAGEMYTLPRAAVVHRAGLAHAHS